MGNTKSKWRNQQLAFYDGSTHETVLPVSPVYFYDDFANTVINIAAAGNPGWTLIDAGAATEAIVANQSCGAVALTHDSTVQLQEAGLTWGDSKNFWLDNGPIFEARVRLAVLPTLLTEAFWGLAGDYAVGGLVAADEAPLIHAFFCADGSGIITIHTDDTVNETAVGGVATGITVVAADYHVYKIDFTDATSVKFYIDGERVAASTTFNMSEGTNIPVQPYFMSYKSGGAGLGTVYIDYCRVWQPIR
jgi:hypothetical protein